MPLQFTVPQFIDVEDKIFGPISVRQFIILLVTAVMAVVIYRVFGNIDFFVTAAVDGVVVVGGVLIAFVKIQGTPLHQFLLHYLQAALQPRLRVWSPEEEKQAKKEVLKVKAVPPPKAALTKSRLTELSLLIDTGGAYRAEDELITPPPVPRHPSAR